MVNFKLDGEINKFVFRLVPNVRQRKKKSIVFLRNQTIDIRIPRSDALPLRNRKRGGE